jgi:hypothetical protein
MSKLFKSKFLLGVLVVAVMAVAGVTAKAAQAQTTTVVASGYTYSGVMKAGMKGPGISTLQAALNEVNAGTTIVVDGSFGPATKAAVMKFQAANGLTADGVVGPMTGAKLAASTVAVITVPGCTSAFDPMTGKPCTGGTLPAGCTSTSVYSSTTGKKCSDGSTTTSGSGEEGELKNFDAVSADENSFSEGEEEELFAFEMEADGSDMMVSRVDIYTDQTEAAESDNADDYFDSATLLVDGKEVADLDVEDWDEDDYGVVTGADGDEFRLRFETDFVVKDGDTAKVTVVFNAASNIDSGDSDNAIWIIDLESDSVRAEDGAGFTDEYGESIEKSINVDDVEAGDLDVSLNSSNPEEQVVTVDDTDDTDGVELLAFDLEANDGDIDVETINIRLTAVGTLANVNSVVNTLHLLKDGDEIASESVAAGAGPIDVAFDVDGDVMIDDGDTAEFTVEADINNLDGADFDAGDGVVASFLSLDAEDEQGDNVEADGTANGENMTFYTVAPEVSKVSASITKNTGDNPAAEGTDDTADCTIVFKVKAVGGTIYINGDNETTDEKEGILLTDGQGGDLDVPTDYSYTVSGANVTTTNNGADNEYFTIPEGATATITLSFHLDPAADGFYGGNVSSIQFGTVSTDQDTRSASAITTGVVADDLETALVSLDDGA